MQELQSTLDIRNHCLHAQMAAEEDPPCLFMEHKFLEGESANENGMVAKNVGISMSDPSLDAIAKRLQEMEIVK